MSSPASALPATQMARILAAWACVSNAIHLILGSLLAVTSAAARGEVRSEPAWPYLAVLGVLCLGFGSGFFVNNRMVRWGLWLSGAILTVCLLGLLRERLSPLGFAWHGHAWALHFSACLALALGLWLTSILRPWFTSPWMGWTSSGLLGLGVMMLFSGHVSGLWNAHLMAWMPWALALVGIVYGLGVVNLFRKVPDEWANLSAIVWVVPFVVQVWALSQRQATISEEQRQWMIWALCGTSMALAGLLGSRLRRNDLLLGIVMGGVLAGSTYALYVTSFGRFENGLDAMTTALFGFVLPYPQAHIVPASVTVLCLAVFAGVTLSYGALLRDNTRDIGLALLMALISGFTLNTPFTMLSVGVSGIYLLIALSRPRAMQTAIVPSREPLGTLLQSLAQAMHWPEPLVVDEDTSILRGQIQRCPIDIRLIHQSWETLEIEVGVWGREEPLLILQPEPGGSPWLDHPLGASHKILRKHPGKEQLSDSLCDLLVLFPGCSLSLWQAGASLNLGPDLSKLDLPTLELLLSELSRTD